MFLLKSFLHNFFIKSSAFVLYTIQCGCILHCASEYVADFVVCKGPSMEPTIFEEDILLTEHISSRFGLLEKGDIVIAKSATNPKTFICKRIKGISGDLITNGFHNELVPFGHVWLEGDNELNSTDSREYGPLPEGLIRARAFFKLWPLHDFGSLKNLPSS